MTLVDIAPWVAGAAFFVFAVFRLMNPNAGAEALWIVPAGLSLLFFLWSLFAVVAEGPMGFWTEHTRNLWGNQIWFDLLLAIGIGWFFIVPEAGRLNMRLPIWLAFVLATGCIGFTAMVARLLYLRGRTAPLAA